MLSLYKLQGRAWLANPFAKSEFVTSLLFLFVLSAISTNGQKNVDAISLINLSIVAQISVLTIMNGAMYSFGFLFFEMKSSVLLKRIGATKISKMEAIGSFVLWGLTMTIIEVLWIVLWIVICSALPQNALGGILWIDFSYAQDINWLAVILGALITGVAYLPIAFLFVSLARNTEIYNILVTFYFFVFGFLGGQIVASSGRLWMDVIGYLSPMGWTTNLVKLGLAGDHLNVPVSWFSQIQAPQGPEAAAMFANLNIQSDWTSIGIIQLALPLGFGVLASGIATKTFKWDN